MQNKFFWEVVIVIVLFAIGATAAYFVFNTKLARSPTPTSNLGQISGWDVYTDNENAFEIKYPDNFEVGEPALIFLPGIVRLTLSQNYFLGTNLAEAYVSVGVGSQPEVRVAPSTYCYRNPETGANLTQTENINGVNFYKGNASGVGAGNLYESTVYRTLHDEKCYEIVTTIHTGNIGNYPEGTVVEFDRDLIIPTLNQIVHTFRFIDVTANWKTYRNSDIGYEFKYPSSWRLEDQSENIDTGHYINLIPPNPEPFVFYFVVSLDNRDLTSVRKLMVTNGKTEKIINFAGQTAYTYSDQTSIRYPYFVPYNGKLIVVEFGDSIQLPSPALPEIDRILSTFKFIQ